MAVGYIVIKNDTLGGLYEVVEEYLSKGWECQGGIAVTSSNCNQSYYYQAMTIWHTP